MWPPVLVGSTSQSPVSHAPLGFATSVSNLSASRTPCSSHACGRPRQRNAAVFLHPRHTAAGCASLQLVLHAEQHVVDRSHGLPERCSVTFSTPVIPC